VPKNCFLVKHGSFYSKIQPMAANKTQRFSYNDEKYSD